MDVSLLLEYGWVLLILIALEGILAADNALVLAIMVKHLPEEKRKKALFYGLAGAFVFRFGSLFMISFLVDVITYLKHMLKRTQMKKQKKKKQRKNKRTFGGLYLKLRLLISPSQLIQF